MSTYRKKIRSGGSLTTFGGGNQHNPTLLCQTNIGENSNCLQNNAHNIDKSVFNNGNISSGRRHRTCNSNGNMGNVLLGSPNGTKHIGSRIINGNNGVNSFTSNSLEGISNEKRIGKSSKSNLIKLNLNTKLMTKEKTN